MARLADLGFIGLKPGPIGDLSYAVFYNPHTTASSNYYTTQNNWSAKSDIPKIDEIHTIDRMVIKSDTKSRIWVKKNEVFDFQRRHIGRIEGNQMILEVRSDAPGAPQESIGQIKRLLDEKKPDSDRPHDIDGCSVPTAAITLVRPPTVWPSGFRIPESPPKSVNDPVGGYAGLRSSEFGKPQGEISSSKKALKLPCNQHDICYQTCGSSRSDCDAQMKSDMDRVCKEAYPTAECPHTNSPDTCARYQHERSLCDYWAIAYKLGLNELGNSAWAERQEQYCKCDD